jgi:signal recognition particle subunit SRP54
MNQLQKMGPLEDIIGMIPGMSSNSAMKNLQIDSKQMDHVKAIIYSMTPESEMTRSF